MKVLIIADSPSADINADITSGFDAIICLDGAIELCSQIGIEPSYIVGDFDTIRRKNIDISSQKAKLIEISDQNSTDMEKGIDFALQLGAQEICLANALGGRADHSFCNLGVLKKYAGRNIYIINDSETIFYASTTTLDFTGNIGSCISIMPFADAIISTTGLKYNTQHYRISIGGASSALNELASTSASIEIQGDVLIAHDAGVKRML